MRFGATLDGASEVDGQHLTVGVEHATVTLSVDSAQVHVYPRQAYDLAAAISRAAVHVIFEELNDHEV